MEVAWLMNRSSFELLGAGPRTSGGQDRGSDQADLCVYYGERLTMREHALRHGWRSQRVVRSPTEADRRALVARQARLKGLASGAPMRGAANGGAYVFALFSDDVMAAIGDMFLPRYIAYIDAEDPTRSSWCR